MNQEDIEKHLNDMLENSEREIDIVFAKRLKSLLELISKMFIKYSENGVISRSQIYAYNRFEKEMERIKEMIHSDYQVIFKEIDSLMQAQYLQNYLRSAYVYEMSTLVRMQYRIPTAQMIKQAITNPIIDLTLPKILNEHRNEIVRRIRIELGQGILAGESYSDMATRIENAVDFSRTKARRVARTEAGKSQSQGRLNSIEQVEKYVDGERFWMAELDTRTRLSHRKLDGDTPRKDGFFHYGDNKTLAPSMWLGPDSAKLSINCRCDIGFKINGKMPDTRRVRNYNDAQYQQRLADRIDYLMANEGLTEKQATTKAKRQIYPPNIVEKYRTFNEWVKDQPKGT